MKIEFELSDEGFHKALDDHISKNIALISKTAIEKRVNEVLEIQVGRIEKTMIDRLAKKAIEDKINSLYGKDYQVRQTLDQIVLQSVRELLKERA